MSDGTAQAVVRRYYDEVMNRQNVAAIETILAPKFLHGTEARGLRGQAAVVQTYFSAFPDIHVAIDQMIGDGETVAARMTWSGTHRGPWLGMAATGRAVAWQVMAFFRVADGRIAQAWLTEDTESLRRQLGAGG
ncbi:MAG TPA: ester cyclase [Thermomicrobiales bacterium]|nr:ester cyclase [Thermomicrobiales bacterium]